MHTSRLSGLMRLNENEIVAQWRSGDTALLDTRTGRETILGRCGAEFYAPARFGDSVAFPCERGVLFVSEAGLTNRVDFGATIRDVDTAAAMLVARADDDAIHIWDGNEQTISAIPIGIALRDIAISSDASVILAAGVSSMQFWALEHFQDAVPRNYDACKRWLPERSKAFLFTKGKIDEEQQDQE
jgi:hypothetical protein